MLNTARPIVLRTSWGMSRLRLMLLMLAGAAAMLLLAACGEVDDVTEISEDGSGVQTLAVTISESDMEDIDGGAKAVESMIEAKNPGQSYEGND